MWNNTISNTEGKTYTNGGTGGGEVLVIKVVFGQFPVVMPYTWVSQGSETFFGGRVVLSVN